MSDPIALAIPAFVVLMIAEVAVAAARGGLGGDRPIWRIETAVANLSCGILSQITGVVSAGLIHATVYDLTFRHLRVADLGHEPATWIVAFIAVDFVFYWWHRASHRVAIMWVGHGVHHQSEDFNLATALRQPVFDPLTAIPFYLPLAFFGLPTDVFLWTSALNTVLQFWFHTRLIDRLGWLESWLNTPSHHRVHHGIDPRYIDKNHGGVLIIWDRMFGTFEAEVDEPTYGVVEGFPHADAFSANILPLTALWRRARAARGVDRLWTLLGPPEWRPEGKVQIPTPQTAIRWRPATSDAARGWALGWLAFAAAGLAVWLEPTGQHPFSLALLAVSMLWTLWSVGGLIDGGRAAWVGEAPRVVLATAAACLLWPGAAWGATLVGAGATWWLHARQSDGAASGTGGDEST